MLVPAAIPVLIVNNKLNEFFHLLCQLDRVWRDFLEWWSSTFLGLLALLFWFITLVVVNTPTSLASFLFHLILHLIQIAILNRLHKQHSLLSKLAKNRAFSAVTDDNETWSTECAIHAGIMTPSYITISSYTTI